MGQIACGTSVSRKYGISDRHLAIATEAGIERIEVALFDKNVDFHNSEVLAWAAGVVEKSGVVCRSVHLNFGEDCDISAADDAARQAAVEDSAYGISIAHVFGAGMAVVHGSDEPISDADRGQRISNLRASLATLCEVAEEHDVLLALELLPRTCLGNTVDEALAIVEGLDERRIGFCLDVNHVNLREDPADAVRRLGKRIWTFHISDNDGVDERHWLPFEGIIDWKGFMEAVRETGYEGQFIFETAGSLGEDVEAYARELKKRFERLMAL